MEPTAGLANSTLDMVEEVALGNSNPQLQGGKIPQDEKRRYSRGDLEGLRLSDLEEQNRRWEEIYRDLEPVIAQEYDGLSASALQKQERRVDGRKQNSRRKKETTLANVDKNMEDGGKQVNVQYHQHITDRDSFAEEDNSVVSEEPYDEDEDSDDDYGSIQRPAFLVEGEPDFESGPPQDGLEYLRRVRWEAAQIPCVKVAKFDKNRHTEQTPYMPKIPDIAKCPENLLPNKDWVDVFLADFAELRQIFLQLDNSREDQLHHDSVHLQDSRVHSVATLPKKPPSLTAILAMNIVSRAVMLRNLVSSFENENALSRDNCLWLFSLCVAVDAPLDAEMSATMRSLLRKCSSLLASKSDPDDDEVVMLNILVAISGKYFRQSEK